jgi:site-specific DNA-cytosine methylase
MAAECPRRDRLMQGEVTQLAGAGTQPGTTSAKLTHGSLFSGVGGIDLGLDWAGFETVWQVEISEFARKVLKKQFPDAQQFEDVRKCGRHNLERVTVITCGFPCQDESMGGKRRGFGTPESPTRSGLWFEAHRIFRESRPPWVLIENVANLLRRADGDRVLSGMEEVGYSCWPLVVGADVLGAPHKRERAWILCHDDACGRLDFDEVMAESWALPPECLKEMARAKGTWNWWTRELAGPNQEHCPKAATPTATMVAEPTWPGMGRFERRENRRARKLCRTGSSRGMNWMQELLYRMVEQKNDNLLPTPEACEDFMALPRRWTELAVEGAEAAGYAEGYRQIFGPPHRHKRFFAIGNSAVPLVPMFLAVFIRRCESRIANSAEGSIQAYKEDTMSNGSSISVSGGPSASISANLAKRLARLGKTEPPDKCPQVEITSETEKEKHAQAMGDAELCEFIAKALLPSKKALRDSVPYLREARKRFAQPGRRVPVPGRPTWGKWIKQNLGISDRHVRRLLANERGPRKRTARMREPRVETESAGIILGNKGLEMARKLRDGQVEAAKKIAAEMLEADLDSPEILRPPSAAEQAKTIDEVGIETLAAVWSQAFGPLAQAQRREMLVQFFTMVPQEQIPDIAAAVASRRVHGGAPTGVADTEGMSDVGPQKKAVKADGAECLPVQSAAEDRDVGTVQESGPVRKESGASPREAYSKFRQRKNLAQKRWREKQKRARSAAQEAGLAPRRTPVWNQ